MYQIFVVYRFRDSQVHLNLSAADFAKRLYYDVLVVDPHFIELADQVSGLTCAEFQKKLSDVWKLISSNRFAEYNKYDAYRIIEGQLKYVSLGKLDLDSSGVSEWVYEFCKSKKQ